MSFLPESVWFLSSSGRNLGERDYHGNVMEGQFEGGAKTTFPRGCVEMRPGQLETSFSTMWRS